MNLNHNTLPFLGKITHTPPDQIFIGKHPDVPVGADHEITKNLILQKHPDKKITIEIYPDPPNPKQI